MRIAFAETIEKRQRLSQTTLKKIRNQEFNSILR